MPNSTGSAASREHELWEVVRAQGKAIIGLEANQSSIRDSLVSITKRLEGLSHEVEQQSRTPWTAIGVVTTVVIFLIGGFSTILFYSYSSNLDHVIRSSSATRDAHAEHVRDGHPRHVLERVDHLHDEIADIQQTDRKVREEAKLDTHRVFNDLNDRITRLEEDLKDGLYDGIR